MHQALSGHFSLQISSKMGRCERAPLAGHRPRTLTTELDLLLKCCCFVSCRQTSQGLSFQSDYHPSWDLFHDVFGWAEWFNDAIFASVPCQLKAQRGEAVFHKSSLILRPLKVFRDHCSCVHQFIDSGYVVNSSNTVHDSDVQLSRQSFCFWLTDCPSSSTRLDWFRSDDSGGL